MTPHLLLEIPDIEFGPQFGVEHAPCRGGHTAHKSETSSLMASWSPLRSPSIRKVKPLQKVIIGIGHGSTAVRPGPGGKTEESHPSAILPKVTKCNDLEKKIIARHDFDMSRAI